MDPDHGPGPWTRTLDSDSENLDSKAWTRKSLDPEKPGP